MFALASELDHLTDEERAMVQWIIIDDGTWTDQQIEDYLIDNFGVTEVTFHPDDWSKRG